MAESLSAECTPLKQEYDSCFNAWFEGYLEPAVAASASAKQREQYSQKKAQEFESKCGKIWENYRACVQVSFTSDFLMNDRTDIHPF
jgi:TRIAP1/MDM35 family protein